MNTVKTFATRDSATGLLRKMGINKADYNKFISTTADDRFAVAVTLAEKHINGEKAPTKEEVAEKAKLQARAEELRADLKKTVTKAKRKEEIVNSRRTNWEVKNAVTVAPIKNQSLSSYVISLIEAGHNNGEIFEAMEKHYDADKSKRHYPAWYRGLIRRQQAAE